MEALCTKYQPPLCHTEISQPLSFKMAHVAFVHFIKTFSGTNY